MIVDIVALSFCCLVFLAFGAGMLFHRFSGADTLPDLLRAKDRTRRGLLLFRVGGAASFLALGASMLLMLLSKLLRRSAIGRVGAYVGIVGVIALVAFLVYMEVHIRRHRKKEAEKQEDEVQEAVQ